MNKKTQGYSSTFTGYTVKYSKPKIHRRKFIRDSAAKAFSAVAEFLYYDQFPNK